MAVQHDGVLCRKDELGVVVHNEVHIRRSQDVVRANKNSGVVHDVDHLIPCSSSSSIVAVVGARADETAGGTGIIHGRPYTGGWEGRMQDAE